MRNLFLVLLIFASAPAWSAENSYNNGNAYYDFYLEYKKEGKISGIKSGLYMGYILGFRDSAILLPSPIWCSPDGAANSQFFDLVGRYLESHPGERHEFIGVLVARALREAWPCKK